MRLFPLLFAALLALPVAGQAQVSAPVNLKVYSAGSLRAAWLDLAQAYEAKSGVKIAFEFGASGLLRERLAKGETADLFTSADTGHPQALAGAGLAQPMQVFAGNKLCALAQPGLGLTQANLLEHLLDPAVRVGSSTPKADPSGDYTWMMFERAGKVKPGAFETLSSKAMQLVGGPNSAPAPANRTAYGKFMEDRAVDVFIAYCTNAVQAQREVPGLVSVPMPASLAVEAVYGMALMRGAQPQAAALRDFILGDGQAILEKHGFSRAPR